MNPDLFKESTSGHLTPIPEGGYAFVPNPLPPDNLLWDPELVEILSSADRATGELAGIGRSLPNPSLLVRPFLRREAVLSSRIEGTRASLSDLLAYETVQLPLFETPGDVHEVHNYVRALEYGLERMNSLPVSLRLICELHGILMEGVRGEQFRPGEFRRGQNFIGPPGSRLENATYVPPPAQEMVQALQHLEVYINEPSGIPPLARLGMIHYQFEAFVIREAFQRQTSMVGLVDPGEPIFRPIGDQDQDRQEGETEHQKGPNVQGGETRSEARRIQLIDAEGERGEFETCGADA